MSKILIVEDQLVGTPTNVGSRSSTSLGSFASFTGTAPIRRPGARVAATTAPGWSMQIRGMTANNTSGLDVHGKWNFSTQQKVMVGAWCFVRRVVGSGDNIAQALGLWNGNGFIAGVGFRQDGHLIIWQPYGANMVDTGFVIPFDSWFYLVLAAEVVGSGNTLYVYTATPSNTAPILRGSASCAEFYDHQFIGAQAGCQPFGPSGWVGLMSMPRVYSLGAISDVAYPSDIIVPDAGNRTRYWSETGSTTADGLTVATARGGGTQDITDEIYFAGVLPGTGGARSGDWIEIIGNTKNEFTANAPLLASGVNGLFVRGYQGNRVALKFYKSPTGITKQAGYNHIYKATGGLGGSTIRENRNPLPRVIAANLATAAASLDVTSGQWNDGASNVYFSTPDLSDPATNGRTYELSYYYPDLYGGTVTVNDGAAISVGPQNIEVELDVVGHEAQDSQNGSSPSQAYSAADSNDWFSYTGRGYCRISCNSDGTGFHGMGNTANPTNGTVVYDGCSTVNTTPTASTDLVCYAGGAGSGNRVYVRNCHFRGNTAPVGPGGINAAAFYSHGISGFFDLIDSFNTIYGTQFTASDQTCKTWRFVSCSVGQDMPTGTGGISVDGGDVYLASSDVNGPVTTANGGKVFVDLASMAPITDGSGNITGYKRLNSALAPAKTDLDAIADAVASRILTKPLIKVANNSSGRIQADVCEVGGDSGGVDNGAIHADVIVMEDGIIGPQTIASGALNGKGDWNVGKTGYSLIAAYDAAKNAASQASVSAIPTNPLLTSDSRLNDLGTIDTTIAAIKAKTDLISNAAFNVNVTSPLTAEGILELTKGCDYLHADGLAVPFTFTGTPSLAGATAKLVLSPRYSGCTQILTFTSTNITGTTEGTILVDIPKASTSLLLAGAPSYRYLLTATLANGDVISLQSGSVTISE